MIQLFNNGQLDHLDIVYVLKTVGHPQSGNMIVKLVIMKFKFK